MKIELLRAWPRRHERLNIELPDGASVADAVGLAGWATEPGASGYAVFGAVVDTRAILHDGDRVEVLRPLELDPKQARRRRAGKR